MIKTETVQTAFAEKFSKFYDIIYSHKNYDEECDYLERLFQERAHRKVHSILDTAAGTGNHVIRLAKRGYQVMASDLSPDMIQMARQKAQQQGVKNIEFLGGQPMQKFSFSKKFDAILCLFASINYLHSFQDLYAYLRLVFSHLEPGGIFICDFWNGCAVVGQHEQQKSKRFFKTDDIYVERVSTNVVDPVAQTSRVTMKSGYFEKGKLVDRVEETHFLGFHYPQEMKNYLEVCGFKHVDVHPFMKVGQPITIQDWNITAVALKG